MTPHAAFAIAYQGRVNFMTPEVLETGWTQPDFEAYELSIGPRFLDTPGALYGVTIVRITSHGSVERQNKLSKVFTSKRSARDYIALLTNGELDADIPHDAN